MLIVVTEQHRIGSTDVEQREVAIHPDTIDRMVPEDKGTVKAVFRDGDKITLVGELRKLVNQVNRAETLGVHPYEQV
jgi:hypothetical protein